VAIIYQISLHGNAFDARNLSWLSATKQSGCRPDLSWRDPIHKRSLLIGEFGCAVSHLRVWQKIAESDINGIILEEDAIFTTIDPVDVSDKLRVYDSVWLGYRWNTLGYWYNAHAYAITPETASYLCDGFSDEIIPVDEWLPHKLKGKKNYFYVPEKVSQIPRNFRPSTIEVGPMKVHVLTVGTDENKMWALEQSASKHGVSFLNLGENVQWRGGTMEAQGGGQKINLVRGHLQTLPDEDTVLFCDAYDVMFVDNMATIIERFQDFGCDIIFAAEKNCWPQPSLAQQFPITSNPYKYLNSGLYIGTVSMLKQFLNEDVPDDSDDQLWMHLRFLSTDWSSIAAAQLDYEGYIFQCDDDVVYDGNQIGNGRCCPCIYHGNGGSDAKERFYSLATLLGYKEAELSAPSTNNLSFEEVAKDILLIPFLTRSECGEIIQLSENMGEWGQMDGDKFPAQEIRVKKLGLWDRLEKAWQNRLGKIAESKWTPMQHYGLRDAFTMRYAMDTQTSLGFHTDASLITGSVKLNDDYDGAELIFTHQNFSNKDVPIGHCLLFPGQVTHGHKVNALKSGIKYSLTMWTSRYPGDVN
tara:strand:- start:814 stop:2562 length:1749 start_codon:yes stop_codon:yes gene_type:complete